MERGSLEILRVVEMRYGYDAIRSEEHRQGPLWVVGCEIGSSVSVMEDRLMVSRMDKAIVVSCSHADDRPAQH